MTIIMYSVFIPKSRVYESEFKIRTYEVGLENDNFIVIKDATFTTINKTVRGGSELNETLNKHSISMWQTGFDRIDGIHYTEYADHNVRSETIRRRIREFIAEKYGFLNNVNLDFIGGK